MTETRNVEMEETMEEETLQEKIPFWKKPNFKRNMKFAGTGLMVVASFVLGEKVQKKMDEKNLKKSEVAEIPQTTESVEVEVNSTETI